MNRKLKKLININAIYCIIVTLLVIANQILIRSEHSNIEVIKAISVCISLILINLCFIRITPLLVYANKKYRKASISILCSNVLLFFLTNILIVNLIDFSLVIGLILSVSVLVFITNVALLVWIACNYYKNSEEFDKDLSIASFKNVYKTVQNSREFRSFLINVWNFIIAVMLTYVSSYFVREFTYFNVSVFSMLILTSHGFNMRYLSKLSKYIKLSWYDYFTSTLSLFIVLFFVYYDAGLFAILSLISLIPIFKKDSIVRKKYLSDQRQKETDESK